MPSTDNWHQHHAQVTRPRFQYGPPQTQYTVPDIPQRNDKPLTRDSLTTILNYFATLIPSHFNGRPVRLIVHGGACMLLHPGLSALAIEQHYLATHSPPTSPHNALPRRTSTRDIDYIHRSFLTEWEELGVTDAGDRIKSCIRLTSEKFQIGADWMNSDADISLPMAVDQNGKQFDPIYQGAIQPNNMHLHTVYESNDKMLTLISVPPVWSIGLKLARYTRYDPGDICLLLRNGTNLNNCFWTTSGLDSWLQQDAWPMGYHLWPNNKKQELQTRIRHAIDMVNSWDSATAQGPVIPGQHGNNDDADWERQKWSSSDRTARQAQAPPPSHHRSSRSESWTAAAQDPHQIAVPRRSLIYDDESPDLDDQWLSPPTRPRSHRPSHVPQSPWHAYYESEVQSAHHFVASVVQESMRAPPGVLSSSTNTAAVRKTRAKQRSKKRHMDRISKWAMLPLKPHDSDSDSDSELEDTDDEEEGGGRYSRTQNRRPVASQQYQRHHHRDSDTDFRPRSTAWHIYAAPTPAPTPSQYTSPPPPPPQPVRQSHSLTTSPYHFNLQRSHSPPPLYLIDSHYHQSSQNVQDIHETSQIRTPMLRRSQSTFYLADRRRSSPPPPPLSSSRQHPSLSSRSPTPAAMSKDRHRPPPLELSPIQHLLDL